MDPQATWLRFLDACAEKDTDEAMEALMDLRVWMTSGGFAPVGSGLTKKSLLGLMAMLQHSAVVEHIN